jgi:ribosomal protein S19E (S16A)
MALNDDAVLAAIQLHDAPVTANDVLKGLPDELITRATQPAFEEAEALPVVRESLDRLQAAGYLAGTPGTGCAVSDAGRSHLVAIGVPPPPSPMAP